MSIQYYLYYLYYTYLGFPFIIRLAIVAICLYTPFFIATIWTLINALKQYKTKIRLKKELTECYRENIISMITTQRQLHIDEIDSILNCNVSKLSKQQKQILTNMLLDIQNKTPRINIKNYQKIINYFELAEFWEKQLNYGKLSSRQKALRKLNDMNIEIPGSVVTSLTYNSNRYLRKRARSSYMHFSKNDPFKFLDEDFDETFNDWDKIEIHEVLSKHMQENGLPNLTHWLRHSKNNKFKCFLIDEISFFHQKECCPYLLQIIKDEGNDIELRKHSIEALGKMGYAEAENELISIYPMQPQAVQQSIIKAIQHIASGKSLLFLENAYYNAHNTDNIKSALQAIYNYGNEGRKLFNSMKQNTIGNFSKLIFAHVSNPLIKYG